MYDSSDSQFFRTTTGIQSGSDVIDESRFNLFNHLGSYGNIMHSEINSGKEIPESSRLGFLEKFLANNFALSDAEDNTSGTLNRGGIADLPLLRTLLAICQKS